MDMWTSQRCHSGPGRTGALVKKLLCLAFLFANAGAMAAGGIDMPFASSDVSASEGQQTRGSSMADELRDLFDRWERVWREGQYDLIPSCVGPNYIRHDEAGDRTVTREAYAAEIAKTRQERPDIRVVVYDHSFEGNRAWFRFAFKWTDPKTGEPRSRAGMQS